MTNGRTERRSAGTGSKPTNMLPLRKQGHPTPAGQKHPVKGKIQRTNTQGRPPSQAAAGRESTQEQGQPIRPHRTASALPRDKKKKIIFPKWEKIPEKRGFLCSCCEIKNFHTFIIFTIQPCAPYSKGEQKKRHVNGPDDATNTDRGRNSYAKPTRETVRDIDTSLQKKYMHHFCKM